MSDYAPLPDYPVRDSSVVHAASANTSGVSWAAILVGAAAAGALSLALLVLGFGLSLGSVSPWSNAGASASTIGAAAIAWLIFTQIAASAIGGYLAGRLRVKWVSLHTDEVYFRDTAHGFMAWAVASLFSAAVLGSAVSSILSGGLHAGASVAAARAAGVGGIAAGSGMNGPAMSGPGQGGPGAEHGGHERMDYFVDSLFRKDAAHAGTPTSPATRGEAVQIFAVDLHGGSLPDEDRQYLGGVVAQETGVSQADGEKRVSDKFGQAQKATSDAENSARQAADTARKAAAHSSLWMFIALAFGAFFASLAATFGGRQRDARN